MATSAWKICLMNLFLEECTSWMMSPCSVSRFFSRKPEQHHRAVTHYNSSGLPPTRLTPFPKPPRLVHEKTLKIPLVQPCPLYSGGLWGQERTMACPRSQRKQGAEPELELNLPATRRPLFQAWTKRRAGGLGPREGAGLSFPPNHPNARNASFSLLNKREIGWGVGP